MRVILLLLITFNASESLLGEDQWSPSFERLAAQFEQQTRPLISRLCLDCHSTESKEGDLDLERFALLTDVRQDTKLWQKVLEMLDLGEMPPVDSEQPTAAERDELEGWLRRYLDAEALANAGDPGPVVLRRLNNAEYTYTIRDLTDVALDPAREFPSEGAGGEGFTNVGNALTMSPSLLTKYLGAGKQITEHAVLLPDGFRFSASTMQGDWVDEILAEIRSLYAQFTETVRLGVGTEVGIVLGNTDTRLGLAGRLPLERYFSAATALSQQGAIPLPAGAIDDVAGDQGLNAKYLRALWSGLTSNETSFLMDGLRERWRNAKPEEAATLATEVAGWQRALWTFGPVGLIGRLGGRTRWMEPVNPVVTEVELRHTVPPLEKGQDSQDTMLELVVTDAGDGNDHDLVLFHHPRLVAPGMPDILLSDLLQRAPSADGPLPPKSQDNDTPTSTAAVTAAWHHTPPVVLHASMFGQHPNGGKIDANSLCVRAPAVIQIRLPAAAAAGRDFVTRAALDPATGGEGSVQVLHVVRGVHPAPIIRSGLLTSELSVIFSPATTIFSDHQQLNYRGVILTSEHSAARQRITAALDAYRQLFPAALCYTQIVPVDEVVTVRGYFREDDYLSRLMLDDAQQARLDRLWAELEYVSRSPLKELDTLHLQLEVVLGDPQYDPIDALSKPLNDRAAVFRQELSDSEARHLEALADFASRAYRGKMIELEADQLYSLYQRLRQQELSHDKAFRLTLARVFVAAPFLYRLEDVPADNQPVPVSDVELANRLSYFLWSSLPDAELLAAAEQGRLTTSESDLLTQLHRLQRDPRIRRLATEFACQYLHIYDFDPLTEKSAEHFPEFAELRGDMYEESILFFTDLFQNDGSLLEMLNADHTFVNERLARFYGIEGIEGVGWRRLEGMRPHGRGGILALATTLAQQSGATRTSPILRGNWVSEVLLGERLPRPPKNVPQLSDTVPEGLTERQLIERHSSDPACAKCHQRIDPIGFALEEFDAIGRRRKTSTSGLPINSRTQLPDGTEIEGLSGLQDYLLKTRRDQFLRQFCRKLLGYALGREVQLSDEPLLNDIMKRLAENEYRCSVALKQIVLSDQFRKIRASTSRP